MEERNKMSEVHRIVMNYYNFTTSTTFANEEDEKSYTQDLLKEIGKIVNLLPIYDVSQQRELLLAYHKHLDSFNDCTIYNATESMIDDYLANNCG